MNSSYQKLCYDHDPSYRLHHITGANVEEATFLPLHYDEDVALSYFRRGGGSVRIEGRYYPIEEGDVILLNPRELHRFTFRDGDHDRLILYIKEDIVGNFRCADPGFLDVFYHRTPGPGNHISAGTAQQSGISGLLEQILALSVDDSGWNSMLAVCRIVELVAAIGQLAKEALPAAEHAVRENSTVSQVLRYINQNFLSIPDADHLAQCFFLNKAYLCRLFKSCVGISLWNYVIFRRLMYSNELIRGGSSIEEACYRSGFQNYSNFFRLYKKYFGVSPSEFHRQPR